MSYTASQTMEDVSVELSSMPVSGSDFEPIPSSSSESLGSVPPTEQDHETSSIESQAETPLQASQEAYSIYSTKEKYFIVILGALSSFWSAISSPIYLPVMPILQKKFSVTEEQLNLTVVVYSVFQGVAPVVFSNLADAYGRRLIILSSLLIYMIANIGLALNSSYVGLMLLRSLQAIGIASTVSVSAGVVGDITIKSERGSFIGLNSGLSMIGQAFGALVGGLIENSFDWRAIFWVLAICSGTTFIVVYIFLPETSRSIVGNGSSLPNVNTVILTAPVVLLPKYASMRKSSMENTTIEPRKEFRFLSPFKILLNQPVYLVLIPSSISYVLWLMMLTTTSTTLAKKYNYSTLEIGLAYIPSGVGGLLGSISSGRVLDAYYKRAYKKYTQAQESLGLSSSTQTPFNIYKARLPVTVFPTILTVIGTLLFSWSLQFHLYIAIPLVGSFLVSFAAMTYLTISTTYMSDLFPAQFSGASSCINLTRCWCAAMFVALLSKMETSMGIGGCYTFMTALALTTSMTIPFILRKSETYKVD